MNSIVSHAYRGGDRRGSRGRGRTGDHTIEAVFGENIGGQVADTLHYELEYDNLIMVSQRGRAGQVAGSGFSGKGAQLGVRTTKAIKKLGCSNLKTLVESDKIIIEDFDLISEMSTFILKGTSKYEADDGSNDDLMMCCVLFAWLSNQTYFKEFLHKDGVYTPSWR